jgi:membrane-associated protein
MLELFDIPNLITSYGYVGIFIIVFLESGIFFALPGDSLLFTAGLFASAFGLNLFILIPAIFVSTFLGGIVGYEIGTKIERLNHLKFFRHILKKEHIDKAHKFFEKHGRSAILFCRFVPIVRTFTPIVAGVAKMHYVSFLKYSLVGSALWSTIVTLLGYFLGRSFPVIKDYLSWVVVLIVFVSILPGVLEYINSKKKPRKDPSN